MTIVRIDDTVERMVLDKLDHISDMEVVYGLPENGTLAPGFLNPKSPRADYDSYEDMVAKAYMNETGGINLPSRPFLRNIHDTKKTKIGQKCDRAIRKSIDNYLNNGVSELEELGSYLSMLVKKDVVRGAYEDNAQSTQDKKGYNAPLMWHGQMVNSISSDVRKKQK